MNELTTPVNLKCSIVRMEHMSGCQTPDFTYVVTDENGIVVASGISSSPEWVRHDAGGHHTKRKFDEMFPQGWHVAFDF